MTEERRRVRATYDEVALLYDQARPGYPEALFDDVVSLSGIPPGGRILEIGCGTGQATVPLAQRGYPILCIELGENLAALAWTYRRSGVRARATPIMLSRVTRPASCSSLIGSVPGGRRGTTR